MRLVLDTSVLVAAIRSSTGAANALLRHALTSGVVVLASVPLVLEYEAVLSRPEHLTASGLTLAEVNVLLDALVSVAQPVRLWFSWRPALRDPNDDMVLETAVHGGATALATFNRADFAELATRFGVEVLLPREIMERVRRT